MEKKLQKRRKKSKKNPFGDTQEQHYMTEEFYPLKKKTLHTQPPKYILHTYTSTQQK